MTPRPWALVAVVLLAASAALPISPVSGHAERETQFPDGTGSVPVYRASGPYFVVCRPESATRIAALSEPFRSANEALLPECAFSDIQAAVNVVPAAGHRILVLPGTYLEAPSQAVPTGACAALPANGELTYREHHACPNVQNLIAIMGDDPADADRKCTTERLCRLQLEGTGALPADVVVDGQFTKLNVIRADRADGFYLRNMVVQNSDFNSVYGIETDGIVFEKVVARYNDEYGFLTFTVDHALYKDCEAHGNGDAGVYPGSSADGFGVRFTTEIVNCDSHHNMAGYSGTAGNSVYAHDNRFHHNGIGIVTDSFVGGHPGMPQDSSRWENNQIYSNNENYYQHFLDGTCDQPLAARDWSGYGENAVCPTSPIPVGTGIMIAGGNANVATGNRIWDNWRFGIMLFAVPAQIRGEEDPSKTLDTSHMNRFTGNALSLAPGEVVDRNGVDFWWDEGGQGNCWEANTGAGDGLPGVGDAVTSDPVLLPNCTSALTSVQRPPNAAKSASLVPCALYSETDNHHPVGCTWMETPPEP